MVVYCDIDGTICDTKDGDYESSSPHVNRIKIMNGEYDKGHSVIYWTARGASTGIDWTDFTKLQLQQWGVKYHKLIFGKPQYDLLIDDKAADSEKWFK